MTVKTLLPLALLALLLTMVSCDIHQINEQKDLTKINNMYYFTKNLPYTGVAVGYHKNGVQRSERLFYNGFRNGTFSEWHLNGQLKATGEYINGRKAGVVQFFNDQSKLERELTYEEKTAKVYKEKLIEWYPNGQKKTVRTYIDDELDGLQVEWHNNGKVKKQFKFVDGELNGILKEFYRDGKLKKEKKYASGIRTGLVKTWHKNGKLKSQVFFNNDKIDGDIKEWYDNGTLKLVASYKENKKDGTYKIYYPNGNIKRETYYEKDVIIGKIKDWDTDGVLIN